MASQHMTVTVVIPALNEERLITKTLRSLAGQDYPMDLVEVVVVDNGSSDNTRKYACDYGAIVMRDDDATIARLRNIGVNAGRGDVLAFLDADMEVGSEWLSSAVSVLADESVGAVGGPLSAPPDGGWVVQTWYLKNDSGLRMTEAAWLGSGNMIMRRDVFDEVGGWKEELVTCEDLDLTERIQARYRLLRVPGVHAVHWGAADNLITIVQKEIWRGRNSFDRLKDHNPRLRDLPSLLLPIVHGVLLILAIVIPLLTGWRGLVVSSCLVVGIPLVRSIMIAGKNRTVRPIPRLILVWSAYYLGRCLSLVIRK